MRDVQGRYPSYTAQLYREDKGGPFVPRSYADFFRIRSISEPGS
jgi:hypothetical protein